MLVVNFDELHFGELLEVLHERNGNVVQRAVRLALAREVRVDDAICIFHFAVTGEAVRYERQSLVALHIAGTFEEFIQRRTDEVFGGGDKARDRHFVG